MVQQIKQNHIIIRKAEKNDSANILWLIKELSVYEKLEKYVTADEEKIIDTIFSENTNVRVLLAEINNELAGQVVFFKNFSTFRAREGLYIEDIFVLPAFRGKGIGFKLMKEVVSIAKMENCFGVDWVVLDWNKSAIDFYKKIGAVDMNEWKTFRLDSSKFDSLLNQ
jgi:GNAT superfamily N-acetyltransferase